MTKGRGWPAELRPTDQEPPEAASSARRAAPHCGRHSIRHWNHRSIRHSIPNCRRSNPSGHRSIPSYRRWIPNCRRWNPSYRRWSPNYRRWNHETRPIRDVASRAGVSPATVSRVFTRPDAVAADTRSRVLAAAEELRYAPHPVARSLAQGRTGNLGIVIPDIANSFSAVITKAVQQEVRRDGYALFLAGSDEEAGDEELLHARVREVARRVREQPGRERGHAQRIPGVARHEAQKTEERVAAGERAVEVERGGHGATRREGQHSSE